MAAMYTRKSSYGPATRPLERALCSAPLRDCGCSGKRGWEGRGIRVFEVRRRGLHRHHGKRRDGNPAGQHRLHDTPRADNALDMSDFHHQRVNHSRLFADDRNPILRIENFWNRRVMPKGASTMASKRIISTGGRRGVNGGSHADLLN